MLAVKFPGTRFTGRIIDTLKQLVDRGSTRIVDLVFVSKTHDGNVRTLELCDLDGESLDALEPLVEDVLGILSEEDVARMGAVLQNGSSAGLMLIEHTRSTRSVPPVHSICGARLRRTKRPARALFHLGWPGVPDR